MLQKLKKLQKKQNGKILSRVFVMTILASGLSIPLLSKGDESSSVNAFTKNTSPVLHDSNIVGNLAGSLLVDQEGNANYDIPIKMSPGTAGMAPTLSVHYDSSAGNGLLGVGFSLQGLTAIARVPQNKALNGQNHGVDFTNNDRFVLNGQQLVMINGAYGGDGAEYRTFIDSQTRITSHGAQGSGPEWFEVQTKGGQTAYYGTTQDSQVFANGRKADASWLLSKLVDQSGNEVDYHYNQDEANGINYPSEIDYTSNSKAGLASYASIKFIYESRADAILAYQAGTKFNTTQRLKEIQSYYKNDLVYDYKLNYDESPNTARSRITSILQCDKSGQCLRPLQFDWQTNEMGWETDSNPAWAPPAAFSQANKKPSNDRGAELMSAYANGLPELVYSLGLNYNNSVQQSGAWKATPTGWQGDNQFAPKVPLAYDNPQDVHTPYEGPGSVFFDVSGSGRDDLIQSTRFIKDDMSRMQAFQATDSGWGGPAGRTFPQGFYLSLYLPGKGSVYFEKDRDEIVGDLLGNGRAGIMQSVTGETSYALLYNGSSWQPTPAYISPYSLTSTCLPGGPGCFSNGVELAYLSGSGLPDLLVANDQSQTAYINTGNPNGGTSSAWQHDGTYGPPTDFRFVVNDGSITRDGGGREVDLLGDGLTDLVMGLSGHRGAWINTGAGFTSDPNYSPQMDIIDGNKNATGVSFADVTGSGLPAMLACGSQGCHAWLNQHGKWEQDDRYAPKMPMSDNNGKDNGVRFVDLLGTGFPDIIFNNGDSKGAWLNKAQTKPDVITHIQDALGDKLHIQYKPITDTSVYTKGSSSAYPNMDYQGPTYVVAQTSSDTDITPIPNVKTISNKLMKLVSSDVTQHVTDYHYANAVYNHLGWGLLGFAEIKVTDETTKITVTTHYSQDIASHTQGMAIDSTTSLSNGTVINKQASHFETKTFGNGAINQTYYLPYVQQTVIDAYDLDGTWMSTKTSTTTLDDYANVTELKQEAKDATGNYVTDTVNQYVNDPSSNWCLGQLMAAQVTESAPNVPNIVRTSSYTYDSNTGMLQSSTKYGSASAQLIKQAHSFVIKNQLDNQSNLMLGKKQAVQIPENMRFIMGDTQSFLTETYKRDAFGNIIETDTTGSDIASRVDKVDYYPDGRFVQTKTNALIQSIHYEYDLDFGGLTTTTDANGLIQTNLYDSFGRLQSTTHPDGTISHIQYLWSTNDPHAPQGSVYEVLVTQTGAPTKISYHDELDREIAQAMQGFGGAWVWQFSNYDERGLLVGKSTPFYAGGKIYETSVQYDALGRVTLTQNSDDTQIRQIYKGYALTTINPDLQQSTRVSNVRGNLMSSIDAENHTTTYQYDAHNDLISLIDSKGNVSTMKYDNWGHKLEMNDPDRGHWTYHYNMLGEMLTQTDPLLNQTTFQYDVLERTVARTDTAGTSTWQYDTALHGIGKLYQENGVSNIIQQNVGRTASGLQVIRQSIGKPTSAQILKAAEDNVVSYSKTYTYDDKSRPITTVTSLNGHDYTESTNYDSEGRPDIITAANKVRAKNNYDDYGYLNKVTDPDSAIVYSTINSMDAQGHVTSVTHSNGLITNYTYDPKTNFLSEILTQPTQALTVQQSLFPSENKNKAAQWQLKAVNKKPGSDTIAENHLKDTNAIQQLDYQYDSLGNVTDKQDGVLNIHDHYDYDDLNRLKNDETQDKAHNQTSTLSYTYDDLGNIGTKSDVGTYVYAENAGPHAVTSITGLETDKFIYDASGNQTHADMQTANGHIIRDMTYTSFDVPKEIKQTEGANSSVVDFYYDANHNRFMRQDVISQNGSTSKTTTFYLDGLEVDTTTDNTGTHTSYKNVIGGTEIVTDENNNHHRYEILTDNISSTNVITDEQGNVTQRFHYDPFGEQQLVAGTGDRTSITRYGFTGQEEVESGGIDLIHMNGRMYDPHLGRFLSADPDIQDPSNSQCLNRYSYCVNNPICFTDPTGFSWWSKLWKHIAHLFHEIGHAIDEIIAHSIVGTIIQLTLTALAVYCPALIPVAAAFAGYRSYLQTGSVWKGLLAAAETEALIYASMGVGALDQNLFYFKNGAGQLIMKSGGWFGCAWTHGLLGGTMALIEGQSFKDGFLSSAVAQIASGPIQGIGDLDGSIDAGSVATVMARGAAAGAVAGTIAASMGGNFENAAWTAAYGEMFNDSYHEIEQHQMNVIRQELNTNTQKGLQDLRDYVLEHGSVTIEGSVGEGAGAHASMIASPDGIQFFLGGGGGEGRSVTMTYDVTGGNDPSGFTVMAGASGGVPGTPLVFSDSISVSQSGVGTAASMGGPGMGLSAYLVGGYTTRVFSWNSVSSGGAGSGLLKFSKLFF